jgi:hypothetical protein
MRLVFELLSIERSATYNRGQHICNELARNMDAQFALQLRIESSLRVGTVASLAINVRDFTANSSRRR